MNIRFSPTKLLLQSLLVIITFASFAVSSLTSIHQVLPVTSLPLSFTTNLITVILSTINFVSLSYLVSSRSRTLPRTVVKAPKSCHIILCSLHWLRITECIEYKLSFLPTKFSQLPNLHTFITSSRFYVLAVLFIHRYSCSAINIILSKNY